MVMFLKVLWTILVPLFKDKTGNLNEKDNYRPLAIICIVPKVFDILILNGNTSLQLKMKTL